MTSGTRPREETLAIALFACMQHVLVFATRCIIFEYICGHSNCGAMKGALDTSGLTCLPHVKGWLEYCSEAVEIVQSIKNESVENKLNSVTRENVLLQMRHLEQYPEIAKRLVKKEIQVHGWIYQIGHGTVEYFNRERNRFVQL